MLLAIKGLNGEGAPGLDGFPVFFFIEYWDVEKSEVLRTLDELCTGNRRLERINKSYLFLLPKCLGAVRVRDFRPISLSNSIYLIILKVLANRLRDVINEPVDPFQSTFIPGQQLVDSAVMAEEIIIEWKRSATKGVLWKVDFTKAYDSIDWNFMCGSMT